MTLEEQLAEDAERLPYCASRAEIEAIKLIHEVYAVLTEAHKYAIKKALERAMTKLQNAVSESTSKPD